MRIQCACLDFIERARLCGGGIKAGGWHKAGNRRSTNVPKEEKKSREEKLELNVAMSAREGKK